MSGATKLGFAGKIQKMDLDWKNIKVLILENDGALQDILNLFFLKPVSVLLELQWRHVCQVSSHKVVKPD